MLSSHRTTTRVDFRVQIYTFFSILMPFLIRFGVIIMDFNSLQLLFFQKLHYSCYKRRYNKKILK